MTQLTTFKALLGTVSETDEVLKFYLDNAHDIICDIRNTDIVENKYLTTQIKLAIELYNKRGAEGQISHSENGLTRMYEKSDISNSLLNQITPIIKTPYSTITVVT